MKIKYKHKYIMEFPKPSETGLTVFTRDSCINCDKLKGYLKNRKYKVVYCDPYLTDEHVKKQFIDQLFYITGKRIRHFPIVFLDGLYIGNYDDFLDFENDF
jgi:glutaredoxin